MVVEGNWWNDGKSLTMEGIGPGRNRDLVRTKLTTNLHSADRHVSRVMNERAPRTTMCR